MILILVAWFTVHDYTVYAVKIGSQSCNIARYFKGSNTESKSNFMGK